MPDPFLELFKEELFHLLDETFDHVQGFYLDKGTSLSETLAAVSAEDASRSLTPDTATIAAQVEHVRFTLDVVNDTMQRGTYEKVDWKEIWRTVRGVSPEEWDAARRRLHESYERLLATMKAYDRWEKPYGIASAQAVLAHTAYHLGGLRTTIGALRSRDKSGVRVPNS